MSAAFFGAAPASAHEVYVLNPDQVSHALNTASPNPFSAIPSQEMLFIFWGTVVIVTFLLVLTASVSPLFERVFDPALKWFKQFAPLFGRLTFGVSMIASGYFGDFFGPELPIAQVLPSDVAHVLSLVLMAAGVLIIVGFLTRLCSFLVLAVFIFTISQYHGYMLTYINYLGEAILVLILGGGRWSVDNRFDILGGLEHGMHRITEFLEPYSFLLLRILFGSAVFFASFYAKFFHSNLALQTVTEYHLTDYFPFSPLFLVLGAFIIEAVIGLCFVIGFEIRFVALVFTFFLTLSIIFFGEAVWPHIILFGVNLALFAHGYDKYTIEMALIQRKREGEPVL